MKLRNAHSTAFTLPDGRTLAVGGVADNVPESMREHALVRAGVFVVVEPDPLPEPASAPKSAPRSGRGGK